MKPETVVRWLRAGFRLYWRWVSPRRNQGRPKISSEVRQLIARMTKEKPTSERTVSRCLARAGRKGDARKLWLAFLRNHREGIAAMDFFTVPTATFRVLYCFFVIGHSRRRVLYFNATEHPSSRWIVQQLREAFPKNTASRYLILDRDRKYEGEVTEVLQSLIDSEVVQTS